MGGSSASDTQTVKTEPWSGAQPYLQSAMDIAGNLAQTPTPNYPYQTTAPLNELQANSLAAKANYGINATAPLIAGYQSGAQRMMSADDVANNPNVQGMLGVNERLVNRNLNENVLPMLGDQAVQAGQYGGSGHGVAQGIAMRGTQEALANANAQTLLTSYGQGLGAQAQALGQSGNTLGLGFIPSQTGAEVGGTMQAQDQALRDEAYNRWMYPYQEPWDRLERAMGTIGQASGMGGTTTSPNPNQGNQFVSGLGGAMTGAKIGSAIAPGYGTAAGAAIGGISGLLMG